MAEGRSRSTCIAEHSRAVRIKTTASERVSIVLFNVKYSPNLGDGVIAECLEHELGKWFPEATIKSIDLAGRATWSAPGNAQSRLTRLALLQRLPRIVNDLTVTTVLGLHLLKTLRPMWRRELAGADLAVLGGGQLIQDGDLNFPLKLTIAADECRRRRLPLAIFAVGAAPSRSPFGHWVFRHLLRMPELVYVAARDSQSVSELRRLGCEHVSLCRDPGFLASQVWPASERPQRTRPRVGICLTHGALLRYHADGDGGEPPVDVSALYGLLIDALIEAGFDVVCFSNGAAEDECALAELREQLSHSGPCIHVSTAPRCDTPSQLAGLISGFDAVVSHRLHACILAYSYRIPHVGFVWDLKVRHFFESVQRAKFAVSFDAASVSTIGLLIAAAVAEGIDDAIHARVLADTRDGIRRLSRVLAGEMGRSDRRRSFRDDSGEKFPICP